MVKVVYDRISKDDFVQLPEEQCITEESLLSFERQIAHAHSIHEYIQALSIRYAEESDYCETNNKLNTQEKTLKLKR